jgi:hypothetical protein
MTGKRQIDNPNLLNLSEWSRDLAQGPASKKGVFLLIEAGMIDLKMRMEKLDDLGNAYRQFGTDEKKK